MTGVALILVTAFIWSFLGRIPVVKTLEKTEATKLVIAHRLSTIRRCDRIIVMNEGRIVEEGTYDELMEKAGFFRELAERQM